MPWAVGDYKRVTYEVSDPDDGIETGRRAHTDTRDHRVAPFASKGPLQWARFGG